MNGHAQISGQVTGRVPNQAGPQMAGLSQQKSVSYPSQMHSVGSHIVDDNLLEARRQVRNQILQILVKRDNTPHSESMQKISRIAAQAEEYIFQNIPSKDDYINMTAGTVEHRLSVILKNRTNRRNISSSSVSTMIPTPGMSHSGNAKSVNSCSGDSSMVATSSTGMDGQPAKNAGSLLTATNGLTGVRHNASLNASDGSLLARYQQSPANVTLGSVGNNIMPSIGMSRQMSQMIPTPGLGNSHSLSVIADPSNEVGFSTMESTMASQNLQQKQYAGSQISRMNSLGGQIGVGSRPNMQQKSSPYGFSNGVANGNSGLIGNNVHFGNGPAVSEGYLNTASFGSYSKPLHQQFDQLHHQPMSQVNTAGISVHEMNNQNLNPMSLQSKPKTNHALMTHNSSMHQIQQLPQVNSQTYDNYQSPQSTRENLLLPQHQVQNFQQQSNQPYGQLVRHQHQHQHQHQQQQQQQQQQLAPKTSDLRQCSITSSCRGQLALEYDSESHNEPLFPQSAQQFQLSQLESQYHQNTPMFNLSKTGQLLDHCGTQDSKPTVSQGSEDTFHLRQQPTESQNDYGVPLSGSQQSNALRQGLRHPQPLQKPHLLENLSYEHNIKEEFQQRVVGQEEAQQPHFKGCNTGPASATQVPARQSSNEVASTPPNDIRARNYHNQLRWLLLLFHARWCSSPQGTCKEKNCLKVQQLLMHMRNCSSDQCSFPRCPGSKLLVQHFQTCQEPNCPVCVRLRKFVASESERKAQRFPFPGYQSSESCRAINPVSADGMINKTRTLQLETSEGPESSKRMKLQHMVTPVAPKTESSPVCVPTICQPHACQEVQPQLADVMISTLSDASELKRKVGMGSVQGNLLSFASVEDENILTAKSAVEPLLPNDVVGHAKKETMLVEQSSNHIKIEMKEEANAPIADAIAGSKSGKPKIKGVSLTELFTPEQIREHIRSLRQWTGQSKARAEKNQAMEHSMSENSCQLCAVEKLTFEPPPIYCTPCGARIKRNVTYYTMGTGDTRHYFCVPCYNEARGETIDVEGSPYPKAKLEKKKNDEDTEEWWVQCDKCEAWQHQICALFNGRRNDGGQAEYTCPNCYIDEIEKGERKPLPQSAVLGAKDLPRTILSDQIEQRLFRRLKQERHERARHQGKSFDEVPGAEALVVRVVSSVDKKLEVKQRFLEIFQEDNYPTEFPYKSKVVLLFQKIEGVEVCLFGMYVQEFGSECQFPNQRRVYLSYLDSVKYFRPEIRTVSGEALRTFVYHEILIGYLEYCKKRGFTSCYIWACPPLKGEDYILYCHPEIQKTPKSDKLREWYLSMLRKATKENIVVELTNLYDHFFVSHGDCKAKVTAARLPYFDGDYWPGAAEDMINQLRQEEDGRNQNKKGKTKKTLTKRALKAAGQTDLTGNASKDALLMQKLGDTICPMKEDFIMVHLQHACSHCYVLMSSGSRWVCNQCKNFQLCDRCHYAEQRLEERERHPINSREKHIFRPIQITDVPSDTKDKDEILESEFFDTRQAFLSLCQGNHYQYDTLRRAKHSSIMVLYHLHNPTAPAFVTTCNTCLHDIETGLGWRCEICPDFDICNACYQKDGGVDHPHKLTNHPSIADRDAQNQEARQKRVLQLRKMLDLLVHASQCRFPHCQYPNCRKVKGLFRHGIQCKTRASGGCPLCKKMWYLLQLHSRACKESDCHVPRCKDLKEHLKRLQQQSDSRRRAAVMEMMRQRATEYAGNSD